MSTKPITIKRQHSVTPKTGQYWEKLKNVEVKKISQYKTKETNIKMRHYWNDVIREMERLAMQQAEQTKIKINDLSTSLPPKLYKRISKIIKLKPITDDHFEDEFEEKKDKTESDEEKWQQSPSFNESTWSFVNKQEQQFIDVVEKLTERPNHVEKKTQQKTPKNWQSEYLRQKQKDRIKWNSKLYQLKGDIWEKPLYEQAEELMDRGADNFLEWLNNLSELSETNITKDVLKSLFSLEVNKFLSSTITIEPKVMGAVPSQVAKTWNMPDKSIEFKLAQNLNSINKRVPTKRKTHAFGTTLPHHLRPWIPSDSLNISKPDIPDEISQCKILFQGITHLRATENFIKYCHQNPTIEKPAYLKQLGCFNESKEKEISKTSVSPLCTLLHLDAN